MLRFSKWIAAVLTVCIVMNTILVYAFAKELTEAPQALAETTADEQKKEEADPYDESRETETEALSDSSAEAPFPQKDTDTAETEADDSSETEETKANETITVEDKPFLTATGNIPKVGDTFADSFIDLLNEKNISATITKEGSVITLTVSNGQGEILELLSQQPQTADSNYQTWNIKLSSTGNLELNSDFRGLGDPGYPFKGCFSDQSITIKSSKTIFKALDTQADLNNVKIEWTGDSNLPILAQTLVTDDTPRTVNMSLSKSGNFSPFIGQLTGGTGLVTLSALDYSAVKASPSVVYQGDVGLICGSIGDGTQLQTGTLTLPTDTVLTLNGNSSVGSLVGSMGTGAVLTLSQSLTLNATLQGQNVGGLVGSMTDAHISFAPGAVTSVSAVLTASAAAGGIAGAVVTETGPLGVNADVVLNSVQATGSSASGVLYGSCTASGVLDPFAGVSFAESATKEVSGPGSCGGVFGTLTLDENGKCTLNNTDISCSLASATSSTAYGGAAGTLTGTSEQNALVVNGCSFTTNINVGTASTNYPKYLGGIVAKQNTATVDAKTCTITVYDPKTQSADDRGFGGVTAYLGEGALLIADSVKVVTDSYEANPAGGGIAGSARKGSIVFLKNSIDLSACVLTTNSFTGQIVGYQDCALVYAPNAAITRFTGDGNMELDDIGNYGELYRIADFLTVSENYTASLPDMSGSGGVYTLSSAEDYACFALAWQSRGVFPTVTGITEGNWSTLKSCTVSLGADLVLTGCGIGGISRDVISADEAFTGVFQGNNRKITLDIGAENQANSPKVTKNDGRIYWHNATGLFAMLSDGATVRNLTLAGSVRISNNRITSYTAPMKSAGLAALITSASDSNVLIQNVSTEVKFDAVCNGANPLYIGGIAGMASNTGTTAPTFELTSATKLAAEITVTNTGDGKLTHIGGVLGAADTTGDVNIVCTGATLGGKIEFKNSNNNIFAGGLVGTFFPRSSANRTVTLTSLKADGFTLSGNAKDRMGGILGGIWADADVTVGGLTVSNATLSSSGSAALGGLVYRAGGKWTVSSADLSGLTISASNAKALGLLVCQGDPYKEPIGASGAYMNVNGLYLEMAEHWDWNSSQNKGYKVPDSITFGSGVFDEFVAYTAYADRSSSTPSYQITANGGGIISLKTDNGTVNMTEGERNTYVNRTAVGQSIQTNLYSRYYYNLPAVMEGCTGGSIDTANELLIWSVYRYADPSLRKHFQIANVTTDTIGGASAESKASFDMKGLSYYPINIINENVTVQYANIRFYNDEIEAKEAGNKLTRGDSNDHSQHYTMHCALFFNFTAENITQSVDRTMTVNGVSFAGSVGVVNGGSGALLCGTVQGESKGGNTSVCTVILAAADEAGKAVSPDGLSVSPEGDYTPVLINRLGSYTGLKANYITSGQTKRAGSSLVGDVGGQGATGVTVEFAGTVRLPENGMFTKAILLNSLRYANGAATYRFNKDKDYTGSTYIHNATHGQELSTTVEYEGKQGCYYDGYGEGYFVSASGSFTVQNDFSAYLPYVALSPATSGSTHSLADGWHELAVNVLLYNLTDGCGTYGHPYLVDANLLKDAAYYINTGIAANGWQIRVSATPETYHTAAGTHDLLLTFTSGTWLKEDGSAYTGDVRKYLQSAYYKIKENIELHSFNGIGADPEWAFMGVITGTTAATTVTLTGGSTAFIKYSYGSVVRDLTVVLKQSATLKRDEWVRGSPEQAPGTFFGGVIGCILGGDNIIENVTVSTEDTVNAMLQRTGTRLVPVSFYVGVISGGYNIIDNVYAGTQDSFKLTLTGTGTHLIPVGGYVGVVAGGGVIFRGTYSNNTGITGTDAQLYQNPIIGRVLDGYAFYEGSGTAPDNGNKNYRINKLTDSNSDLSWDGSKITVNNKQGLLVLSAAVSSGAGSKSSYAYTKGKARNAAYDKIGAAAEPGDYSVAKRDESAVWSNSQTPYLLSKYAGYTGTSALCSSSTSGIAVEFANSATFDMTGYDNGYRALSARYVSNAAFSTSGVDASTVVMRVNAFNGNNTNVKSINMLVREYADDDFHAASLGGIFNIVWTKQRSGGTASSIFAQNLTLTNCNVSLEYINSAGAPQTQATAATLADSDGRSCVTVGGFIGSISDITGTDMSLTTSNYLFKNLRIQGTGGETCTVKGPNSAGGLIGAAGMTNNLVKDFPGKLLSNSSNTQFGPSFLNCSYSGITVTAKLAAGGLIGYIFAFNSKLPQFTDLGVQTNNKNTGCYATCTVTENDFTVGSNSTICAEARRSVAGGVFGAAGIRVRINDPLVNSKTALTVAGAGDIKPLVLNNVTIQSSQKAEDIKRSDNIYNGPTSDASAAGIISRIGNVNPTFFYDIRLENCTISTNNQTTNEYAGSIVGYGYTNTEMTMQRCQVNNTTLNSQRTGGFLGYGYTASSFKLDMKDCKIEESSVNGTAYAGGIVGDAASQYYFFNILIKNTSVTCTAANKAGRLFGNMNINNTSSNFWVYANGISVYADDPTVVVPERDGYCDAGKKYIGYIAYADYAGTETAAAGSNAPYVTVNPSYTLQGADKTLTGDAVGKINGDSYGSVAARIWADNKNNPSDRKNLVSYYRITSNITKDVPEISTFNAIQGCGPDDLPVLVMKGADARVIDNYLDVITNGGYSESKVTPTVSVYYYNAETDSFEPADEDKLNAEPQSVYLSLDNKLSIKSDSFDNTRNRFSLVEASFEVTVNGDVRNYTVSVPVVTIRELQYNFMSTFSYGAEFQTAAFDKLKTHVLESTGNPFTAYLTYQYNHEKDTYVSYDWLSYMNDGGSMLNMDKILSFSSGLPSGTQMILVDCQNGNKAYQYTTLGTDTTAKTEVRLSSFTSVSDGESFIASMAEILGVTKAESADGNYVIAEDIASATLRLKDGAGGYTYYRPLSSSDPAEITRYELTVPDLSVNIPNENYYLLITVPEQAENPDFYINGSLSSSVSWTMPSNGTWVHRYDTSLDHAGNNNESTYQISTGYQQTLISTAEVGKVVNLENEEQKIQVSVQDTITFSNQQAYGDGDPLFLKLSATLQQHKADTTATTEIQFPAGTTGTARFYIQGNGQYFTLAPDGTWTSQTEKTEAVSYPWVSNGAGIDLPLSDGTKALDLSGVRKLIKGTQDTGSSDIIVTAEMDINFSGRELLNSTVPASENNGADIWAQLHYVGQISTQEFSLDYSSARATAIDNAKYYRSVTFQAILSMDAAIINQLGINPLELVADYLTTVNDKTASRIDLTAALNLASLQDVESVLRNTDGITFKLTLQRRQGNIYVDVPDAQNYIAFDSLTYADGGWSWTIPKNQYYDNGALVKNEVFDGTQFTMPRTAYVFTDQTDYANYKIKLAVTFHGNAVELTDSDAYVVYTFACIKPAFYVPEGA